jgi:hypothetical protein
LSSSPAATSFGATSFGLQGATMIRPDSLDQDPYHADEDLKTPVCFNHEISGELLTPSHVIHSLHHFEVFPL